MDNLLTQRVQWRSAGLNQKVIFQLRRRTRPLTGTFIASDFGTPIASFVSIYVCANKDHGHAFARCFLGCQNAHHRADGMADDESCVFSWL
ncbi:hypothetical protein AOG23_29715 [Rhizobium acidisoli]|nr:hypothetical protein AOG23_29715 [Rhizobium acidisoli]